MEIVIDHLTAYAPYSKTLERRGFGVRRKGRIYLHPVEVLYLVLKDLAVVRVEGRRLSVLEVFSWATSVDDRVLPFYYVYEDLRGRGFKPKIVEDMVVARRAIHPVEEAEIVGIPEIVRGIEGFVLGIVDGENEVTYYGVEEVDPKGSHFEKVEGIRGYLVRDRILSEDVELFERYFYGSLKDGVVTLSIVEGLYLHEIGAMDVFEEGRRVSSEELFKRGKMSDPNFDRRYEVYRDLKMRNFVVKTGLKFGSDFRLYERVESVKDLPHSKYLVTIVDDRKMPVFEIVKAVRLAQNVRKKQLFVYKEGNDNKYVMIERIKI